MLCSCSCSCSWNIIVVLQSLSLSPSPSPSPVHVKITPGANPPRLLSIPFESSHILLSTLGALSMLPEPITPSLATS
ncbi:hypothetical protein M758_5G067500 [Ceratodon purpureus]|nr:hypothetical protein M758_5G067500 [Ceratodon purpureus]